MLELRMEKKKLGRLMDPKARRATMAEAKKARLKLAKQDRKEANELLVAVGKQDVARVRRLFGVGHKFLIQRRALALMRRKR